MEKSPEDEIVIEALYERFSKHRLPKALELEKRVNAGEKLTNSDMVFLDTVFRDAKYILRFSDKYPEYQELVTKGIEMYKEITQKALENEKNK